MTLRPVLLAIVVASGLVISSAAAASPRPTSLRVPDAVGDSTSADRGHDITAMVVSTVKLPYGAVQLQVRLETAGDLPVGDAAQEVTFTAGDCSFRLGHWSARLAPATKKILGQPTFTYDCGALKGTQVGTGSDIPEVEASSQGRAVIWLVALEQGSVLAPGAVLKDLVGYSSFGDQTEQLWAPLMRGKTSYDIVSSTAAFRVG